MNADGGEDNFGFSLGIIYTGGSLASFRGGQIELHASFVTLTELEYVQTQERNAQQAAALLAFAKPLPRLNWFLWVQLFPNAYPVESAWISCGGGIGKLEWAAVGMQGKPID